MSWLTVHYCRLEKKKKKSKHWEVGPGLASRLWSPAYDLIIASMTGSALREGKTKSCGLSSRQFGDRGYLATGVKMWSIATTGMAI